MEQEPKFESREVKWENLSEVQKEILAGQFGIEDAEALESALSPEEGEFSVGAVSRAEAAELVRQVLKDFE